MGPTGDRNTAAQLRPGVPTRDRKRVQAAETRIQATAHSEMAARTLPSWLPRSGLVNSNQAYRVRPQVHRERKSSVWSMISADAEVGATQKGAPPLFARRMNVVLPFTWPPFSSSCFCRSLAQESYLQVSVPQPETQYTRRSARMCVRIVTTHSTLPAEVEADGSASCHSDVGGC
jgi:hypothetical protein